MINVKSKRAWDLLRKKKTTQNPQKYLQENVPFSEKSARNFLANLVREGYTEIRKNSRGVPKLVVLRTNDIPATLTSTKKSIPLAQPAPPSEVIPITVTDASALTPIQASASAPKKVAVLLDYRNALKCAQDLPNGQNLTASALAEVITYQVIKRARHLGDVKYAFAFVPSYTSEMERNTIGLNGFFVVDGPKIKFFNCEDTCDLMLSKFATMMLGMHHDNFIDTFVVISNDGDFVHAINEIANHNRKVVVFHFDRVNSNLTRNGTKCENIAPLIAGSFNTTDIRFYNLEALKASDPHRNGNSKLAYSEGLKRASDMGKRPDDCLHTVFLRVLMDTLIEKDYARRGRKNFNDLKNLLWGDLQQQFSQYLTIEDCHFALSAAVDFRILSGEKTRGGQQRYYVLNEANPLLVMFK